MTTVIPWQQRAGLKVEEAAAILGICRSSAWKLVATSELESFKIGKSRRVVPASVMRLQATRAAEGAPARAA